MRIKTFQALTKTCSPILFLVIGILGIYGFWVLYGFLRVFLIDGIGLSYDSHLIGWLESLLPIALSTAFVLSCVFANILMRKIESMKHPTIVDHIRQSGAWYLCFVATLWYLFSQRSEDNNELWYAVVLIFCIMTICAIFINAISLSIVQQKLNKEVYE